MEIKDFDIIAPVPLEHLQSGAGNARKTGFVAFGLRKLELFRQIDDLRELLGMQRLPISAIQTVKGGRRKSAPPCGPELVATPSALELPL